MGFATDTRLVVDALAPSEPLRPGFASEDGRMTWKLLMVDPVFKKDRYDDKLLEDYLYRYLPRYKKAPSQQQSRPICSIVHWGADCTNAPLPLLRSTDGGNDLEKKVSLTVEGKLPLWLNRGFAISPSNSDTLYFLGRIKSTGGGRDEPDRLWISEDGGDSFTRHGSLRTNEHFLEISSDGKRLLRLM